jgi:hypothetical protein
MHGGAGLAGETDNRAARAHYRWDVEQTPANGSGSLWDAGEGPVAGLGGLEPEIYKGEGAVNYCKLVHKFSIEPAHSRRTLFIPIYLNITPLYHLNIPIHHLHIKF